MLHAHTLFPVTEFLLPLCRHLLFKYTPKYIHNKETYLANLGGISYLGNLCLGINILYIIKIRDIIRRDNSSLSTKIEKSPNYDP